ncbi:type II toxin-antitoxin system VapC family toxin [Mucilaginibacter sp.]|uniref:type II toxin-antitoxin system VapC family toxin n=1 Tax=Mucilaginibacter sp. TaxID=1882438 RepID=UPI0026075B7E|nr:type II toxin-antitoxin system VapC family toxin [Mucilaginibacter sp.]MDB4920946.1 vapC 4 [Mucilaginibacter sp.]
MRLLLDTNILIFLSKDPSFKLLEKIVNPEGQRIFISVVSIAELNSLSIQYKWGIKRWQVLNFIIEQAVIIEVNQNLINIYAEMDAFSQRRNPSYSEYSFNTPRNMGKNDLWLASIAALLGL